MPTLSRFTLITLLLGILTASDPSAAHNKTPSTGNSIASGYTALKLFLEDEQYLTTIRRTKMVLTFSGISDASTNLVDEITDASEQAIEELEKLKLEKPSFTFEEFPEENIAIVTLDSLRMATAREFLFNDTNFEKDLLISQLKVLRVISHLASQLAENETSNKRKTWLNNLARRYERFYQKVYARVKI